MKWLTKGLISSHRLIYRLTNGAIGGRIAGMPVLLLHSVGHRTGKARITPLTYFQDGDNYIIIASNGGSDKHPGWYYNLQHQPNITIKVRGESIEVMAEQASPEAKVRLWPELIKTAPIYDKYQQKTARDIPIFILRPSQS